MLETDADDDNAADLAACAPTEVTYASAAADATAGVALLIQGLQLWAIIGSTRSTLVTMAFLVLIGSGASLVFFAAGVLKLKTWATLAAALLGGAIALFGFGWFYVSTTRGFFSWLGLVTPFLSALGAVLSLFGVSKARSAGRARSRLKQRGFNPGL